MAFCEVILRYDNNNHNNNPEPAALPEHRSGALFRSPVPCSGTSADRPALMPSALMVMMVHMHAMHAVLRQ